MLSSVAAWTIVTHSSGVYQNLICASYNAFKIVQLVLLLIQAGFVVLPQPYKNYTIFLLSIDQCLKLLPLSNSFYTLGTQNILIHIFSHTVVITIPDVVKM